MKLIVWLLLLFQIIHLFLILRALTKPWGFKCLRCSSQNPHCLVSILFWHTHLGWDSWSFTFLLLGDDFQKHTYILSQYWLHLNSLVFRTQLFILKHGVPSVVASVVETTTNLTFWIHQTVEVLALCECLRAGCSLFVSDLEQLVPTRYNPHGYFAPCVLNKQICVGTVVSPDVMCFWKTILGFADPTSSYILWETH